MGKLISEGHIKKQQWTLLVEICRVSNIHYTKYIQKP